MPAPQLLAKNDSADICLLPQMANRHGLITGSTGTGKTITLQVLAERFSAIGVPCLLADVKGDLSGIAKAGGTNTKIAARANQLGLTDFTYSAFPTTFWDVWSQQGHPVRATVSDMGPLLLARMLTLNETQTGVLYLVFKIADDNGLLLLDLKDLRAMLQFVGDQAGGFTTEYGNISAASVGAIQRGLLTLESQGGDQLFGEPMLNIADLMQTDGGRGVINILAADKLIGAPKVYSVLLLWLLAELYENLPEAGDLDKPKLVFFFDEAHLLFDNAPAVLVDKIEQVARLIRSKGVGVYFITQRPADVPDEIAAQLGNRIQHALRAFTPKDQKAVRAAADTMRDNPGLDEAEAIMELEVGEALVSLLDEKGKPGVTERAFIVPPQSQVGPISAEERHALMQSSLVAGHYEQTMDRESAYEILKARAAQVTAVADVPTARTSSKPSQSASPTEREAADTSDGGIGGLLGTILGGRGGRREGTAEALAKSAARAIGSQVGRAIVRGVLGSLLGGGRR
ncbi:MAG: helicase HerA-like domain-containing protein [Porticoccaceae bacterium]